MTTRIALLAALLLAAVAAPAHAAELVGADGAPAPWPYSAWGHAMELPVGQVTLEMSPAPCGPYEPRATGCADDPPRVLVQSGLCPRSHLCRVTIQHELGHVADLRYMTDDAHRAFARIFGRTLAGETWSAWWHEAGQDGGLPEWFAEGSRLCALNRHRPVHDSVAYGYAPTRRQHIAVCGLLRVVRRRALAHVNR